MASGGKREGAGRPTSLATLEAQKARELLLERLIPKWGPIVDKAIEQAVEGNQQARDWLSERGLGKVTQGLDHTTNGKDLPIPILNAVPSDNGAKEDTSA